MYFLYQVSRVSLVSLIPGLLVPSVTPFLGSNSPCKEQITCVTVIMITRGNVIRLRKSLLNNKMSRYKCQCCTQKQAQIVYQLWILDVPNVYINS